MKIHRVRLAGTNAYVISGDQHVLVDTGPARSRTSLLAGLSAVGLSGRDLTLMIATHAHSTSVGSAAFLQRTFNTPVAVHCADAPILASGIDRSAGKAGPIGAVMRMFGDTRFDAAKPDIVFGHTLSLLQFGCDATVVHAPGHTIGSTAIVLSTGDAIIGDLLMGGSFGGRLLPSLPYRHYFAEVPERIARSIALLSKLGVKRLHPGTGDVLQMDDVRSRMRTAVRVEPLGPSPARRRERRMQQQPWLSPLIG